MRRRDFIKVIAGSAAGWPLAGRAQQSTTPVIGFLHTLSPEKVAKYMAEFHQGLKEAGYTEGQNLVIEYRWAEGQYDRLPEMAADLVRLKVSLIVALGGVTSPQVAKAATSTIPIVFGTLGDPVSEGLVDSLSRPGGNATGVSIFGPAAISKRLQLLHELVPHAATIAFLMNPNNPNGIIELKSAQTAASSLGSEIVVVRAGKESELGSAFADMAQQRAGALLAASDPFFLGQRAQIVALAAQYRIPAIYYVPEFAEAGGLMSYGNKIGDAYHIASSYVGRILKGEKPSDLPVQQATQFELAINYKTAKSLGIEVPVSMQLLADEVIE